MISTFCHETKKWIPLEVRYFILNTVTNICSALVFLHKDDVLKQRIYSFIFCFITFALEQDVSRLIGIFSIQEGRKRCDPCSLKLKMPHACGMGERRRPYSNTWSWENVIGAIYWSKPWLNENFPASAWAYFVSILTQNKRMYLTAESFLVSAWEVTCLFGWYASTNCSACPRIIQIFG